MKFDNLPRQSPDSRNMAWLVGGASLAVALILWPFNGAIWWAVFAAIVFAPMHRRVLASMPRHRNSAALLTLAGVVVIVILPLALLGTSLAQQVGGFVESVRAGEIRIADYFQRALDVLPLWTRQLLERFGIGDLAGVQQKVTAGLIESNKAISERVFTASQLTLDWMLSFALMLYLLFFLFRDGETLRTRIVRAMPLASRHKVLLTAKFVQVVRATVQGSILVALVQGLMGSVAFWVVGIPGALLWGALMAALSMLPAMGSALVWAPVALYLLATGSTWQGAGLALWGVLVISLIDNLLRPALVSKSTDMPDYVVLMATVGGIAVFGINGFVIGPVIMAMFLATWSIFARERAQSSTDPVNPKEHMMKDETSNPRDSRAAPAGKVENDHNKSGSQKASQKNEARRTPDSRSDREAHVGSGNQSQSRSGRTGR